eukprot:gene20376-31354_t
MGAKAWLARGLAVMVVLGCLTAWQGSVSVLGDAGDYEARREAINGAWGLKARAAEKSQAAQSHSGADSDDEGGAASGTDDALHGAVEVQARLADSLAKPKSEPRQEYRGQPGAWAGECPFPIGSRTVNYPLPPRANQPSVSEMEARWTVPDLPPEVKAEHANESRYEVPKDWASVARWRGHQWWTLTNFCVRDGKLILFDRAQGVAQNASDPIRSRKKRFPLYNEFTRSKNRLSYNIESVPHRLPGPLVDNPAWILSFWCQDLFHSTLTLLPAFAIKQANDSDIYVKICSKSPCKVKLGNQLDWSDPYNKMFPGHQFFIPGNPYWSMYRAITDKPYRIRPMYPNQHYNEGKTRCYREGILDKKWHITVSREEAVRYSATHLDNFGIKRVPRQCRKAGGYRMTLINRQGKTRRLSNIQEVSEAALCHGFNVSVVAFENFAIRDQIELVANTDLLVGMHGNGLIWTQFQEIGAYEIEIMGIWYERYAKLWGHGYNNTSTRDKFGRKGNEYVPFEANMTEITLALARAKEHLDRTSCGERILPSMTETHKNVWE